MMSIGTLLAYTLVAISVMILRYGHEAIGLTDDLDREHTELQPLGNENGHSGDAEEHSRKQSVPDTSSLSIVFMQFFNIKKYQHANVLSSQVATSLIVAITILLVILDSILVFLEEQLIAMDVATLCATSGVLILLIHAIFALASQPQSLHKISFQVPFVPYIPVLSMFVNFYLMLQVSL